MSRSGKVNIRQVAAHCGVSPATVSRVLNGNTSVDADLARRVMAAAEELGYRPALSPKGKGTLVFVTPQLGDTYCSHVAGGILDAARSFGYNVVTMLSGFDPEQERACLQQACALSPAGIIFHPVNGTDPLELAPDLKNTPIVITGPRRIADGLVHIHTNAEDAAYISTRYLLLLGRRTIAFIAPFWSERVRSYEAFLEEYHSPARGRFSVYDQYAGYCHALEEAGLSPDPKLIAFGDFSYQSGCHCAQQLLSSSLLFDAILTPNDRSGAGVLKQLGEQGFRVPDQISIACLNGGMLSDAVTPALTTMSSGSYEMGVAAVEQMNRLILGEPAHDVRIDTKLLIKKSTQMIFR